MGAFGPQEHACLVAAARLGFDLRVGFENSLTDADGTPHADNAASVAALVAQFKQPATLGNQPCPYAVVFVQTIKSL